MVARRIIACLDLAHGRVVKGVRFRHLRAQGDPRVLARTYEADGADEIVILQTDGSLRSPLSPRLVRDLARGLSIPLTVGGGIRTVSQAETLLHAGADRVSFNTAATEDPTLLDAAARRFGRQAVVLAMDVATRKDGSFEVRSRSATRGTQRDPVKWSQEGARLGAGEVLLTSVDRDGTRTGYDLDLIRLVRNCVAIPIIASGGASGPASFLDAFRAGADAALAAGIFHDGSTSIGAVKRHLSRSGLEVRG
jgi:imidazole glycerol-phosphate synthase subunit HisF